MGEPGDDKVDQLRPLVEFLRANYQHASSREAREAALTALAAFEKYDRTHPPLGDLSNG